jgi:hypothetical protein
VRGYSRSATSSGVHAGVSVGAAHGAALLCAASVASLRDQPSRLVRPRFLFFLGLAPSLLSSASIAYIAVGRSALRY